MVWEASSSLAQALAELVLEAPSRLAQALAALGSDPHSAPDCKTSAESSSEWGSDPNSAE